MDHQTGNKFISITAGEKVQPRPMLSQSQGRDGFFFCLSTSIPVVNIQPVVVVESTTDFIEYIRL